MNLPAIDAAIADRRITDKAFRVYRFVLRHLAVHEYRPLKQLLVQNGLAMDKGDVSRSLALLVVLGYLDRGPQEIESRVYTYRLAWSAPMGAETPTT